MRGLPGLRKPKTMAGLPGLSKKKPQPKPQPPPLNSDEINIESDRLSYIARLVGDKRLAERVMVIQQRFPRATIPEAVSYSWLEESGVSFSFQAPVMGGRSRSGGQVLDFLIDSGGTGLAWFINGDYWHAGAGIGAQEKSVANALVVLGQTSLGLRIEQTVILWENKIYSMYPAIFEMALTGIEVGQ